jgi:acyl dehydratase
MNIIETKDLRRLGGGAVTIEMDVENQHHETVMKGTWKVLVAARPN